MSEYKLRFIKPCRTTDSSPPLTPARVIENKKRRTETTLLLDLNLLIKMEEVFLRQGDLNELGLTDLINLINQCPPNSLCLSPGFALSEVHPNYKKQCGEIFEVFLSTFCPQMIDHPTATRNFATKLEANREKSFIELDLAEQYLLSISYYSLIKIHIIDAIHTALSPFEKFSLYMDCVCNDINMLSAVEAEIAKYCFCEKSEDYDQQFKDKIGAIKDNFLNRNAKPQQRLKNIFNGVQDLKYGISALKFSEQEFAGKNQETWIATLDSKLFWLTESIYHHPKSGEPDGKYYATARNIYQKRCKYWQSVDHALVARLDQRRLNGKGQTPLDENGIQRIHNTLINKGLHDFAAAFPTPECG